MKLPGRAWLEFEVEPREGGARIRQTAIFDPVGLSGLAYWYLLYPLHCLVFSRMLENIARAATFAQEKTDGHDRPSGQPIENMPALEKEPS
jgi:hypothetical protein